MLGQIGSAKHSRSVLLVAVALLGWLLIPCARAAAKTVPELTLNVPELGTTIAVSTGRVSATQAPGGPGEAREAIAITSATPSVCEVLGYIWGPGEEPPAEREMSAEVRYVRPGMCTFVASVKATGTTEAAEVSRSVGVISPPLEPTPHPIPEPPKLPELDFLSPGAAYLGGSLSVEATSTRPGLSVSSTTPAVCTVAASQMGHFMVIVDLITTGTCTLIASLPKTAEHEALEVTKSIVIATIAFTSTPPSSAVAGGSYEVTASSAPGLPVHLGSEGSACTFTKPRQEQSLPPAPLGPGPPALFGPDAPATVYFLRPGTCTITAEGNGKTERLSQSFTVAMGAPEQITFTSAPPSNAVVGESYSPTVRSSLGWPVSFSIATPAICKIELGSGPGGTTIDNGVRLPPSAVHFIAAGTCTIDVRPIESSQGEAPEAHQSFLVQAAPESTPAPSDTRPAPTSFKLVGHPRVNHKRAAIKLKTSCSGPGTLSWRVTFKGNREAAGGGLAVFSTGAMKITGASTPILTVKPTNAALRALKRAHKHRRGLSVKAVLTFDPSPDGRPVSLERSILVQLA